MARIFLCDDAPDYRYLVREVLGPERDIEIVGEGGNGRECLEHAPRIRPDVIVLDLDMPEMDGFAVLPVLRRALPDVEVLALSSAAAPDVEARALALGATAYLRKPLRALELPGAMRAKVAALDRRGTPRDG